MNAIKAGDVELLLTVSGGGEAVHLARALDLGSGRPAVLKHHLQESRMARVPALRNYDRSALAEPRWSEKTLCGRVWVSMIGGDGGSLSEYRDIAFVPSCKRCMAVMDKLFPQPTADQRLPLIAQMAADLVCEHGYAEVRNVPGDQQATLRKQARALIRKQTGYGSTTHVHSGVLHIVCDPVYNQHADEYSRAAMEAISDTLFGERNIRSARMPDCTVYWDTWAAGSS